MIIRSCNPHHYSRFFMLEKPEEAIKKMGPVDEKVCRASLDVINNYVDVFYLLTETA